MVVAAIIAVLAWSLAVFVTPPAGPATAAQAAIPTDLHGHWSLPVVSSLMEQGIIRGFPDGTFRPDDGITRLEAALLLGRALVPAGPAGRLPYSDLEAIPAWAREELAAAVPLVQGVPDGRGGLMFQPYEPLTRAQLAVLAARWLEAAGLPAAGPGGQLPSRYTDAGQVPPWARAAFDSVVAAGILEGDGAGRLAPLRTATRAELAAITARLLDYRERRRTGGGPDTRQRLAVVGYYGRSYAGDTRALESLRQNSDVITAVAETGFYWDWDGKVQGVPDRALHDLARARGIPVWAVITNDTGSGFDRSLARHLLNNDSIRSAAIQNIVDFLLEHGYSGLNLDLENVDPVDRAAYNRLAAALSQRLQEHGLVFTVAVPAKTGSDPGNQWSGAFDYEELSRWAAAIIPMGYDQHWLGGDPGPVAATGWVDQVLAYAVETAGSSRVWLGVPAYGYRWAPAAGQAAAFLGRDGPALAAAAGVPIQWDDDAQVPYFTYIQHGLRWIAYYENAHSLRAKLRVVRRHGVAGIAIWRLGYEDPAIWDVLRDH